MWLETQSTKPEINQPLISQRLKYVGRKTALIAKGAFTYAN